MISPGTAEIGALVPTHRGLLPKSGPNAFDPVEPERAHDALQTSAAWQVPPDGLWVTTTVAGEEAYKFLPEELLPRDLFPKYWAERKV